VTPPVLSPTVVEQRGLVLRCFDDRDVTRLQDAFADPDIALWNPGVDRAGKEIVEWMESRADWSDGSHASWAVSDPAGVLLGSVSVHHINWEQADAEIGYWVAPWARRQRVGVRAVMTAADFAFTALQLHRVYLFHAIENVASCRLSLAAGFRLEGELRQSFRYGDGAFHDEHLHARLADE
jgi:RimJ/RimL family protein N-acetyltransferase